MQLKIISGNTVWRFFLANHKSAIKRARQSENRRVRNRINKTRIKNVVKAAHQTTTENPEPAAEVLKKAMSVIDRAAARGTIHRKTASRKIARLSKRLATGQAAATS
jgi:small subunit ribosomal protein S20